MCLQNIHFQGLRCQWHCRVHLGEYSVQLPIPHPSSTCSRQPSLCTILTLPISHCTREEEQGVGYQAGDWHFLLGVDTPPTGGGTCPWKDLHHQALRASPRDTRHVFKSTHKGEDALASYKCFINSGMIEAPRPST